MNLFVAKIPYYASVQQLKEHFSQFATVVSAKIVVDQETGKSKGFGFVELEMEKDEEEIISVLNTSAYANEKPLVVKKAREGKSESAAL